MNIFTKRTKTFSAVAAGLMLSLSLAACSGTDDAAPSADETTTMTTSAPATPMEESMAPSMEESMEPSMDDSMAAMNADAPFGPGCAAVPASGAGSFDGMSQDPVATAASNNEELSTLVTAVTAANLGDTLNNAEDITVFAPANSAFAAMDPATLEAALADPSGLLTDVLTAHVVGERLAPADLAGEFDTLNPDQKIMIEGSGEDFTVNGSAAVVCGNVQTANATVYIIDGVLLPQG
ncbi:MAG: fasciclin domain-containing protein [Arachnia sp.]